MEQYPGKQEGGQDAERSQEGTREGRKFRDADSFHVWPGAMILASRPRIVEEVKLRIIVCMLGLSRLPEEHWLGIVGALVENVRKQQRIPCDPPVVISDPNAGEREDNAQWQ